MLLRSALAACAAFGLAATLGACNDIQANSGPPVAGTTPSTISYIRQESAAITQGSQGLQAGSPAPASAAPAR